jgi:hypothetical protein
MRGKKKKDLVSGLILKPAPLTPYDTPYDNDSVILQPPAQIP